MADLGGTPGGATGATTAAGNPTADLASQLQQNFAQQQAMSALQQDFALKQNVLKTITENAVALAEALGEVGGGAAKNSKADAQSASRLFGQ